MALGRPLGAKLFLEGIEVPLIGATITSTVGQASIAYVDVVPHQLIMDIKPRTRVDIFVRNYQDEGPKCVFPYVIAWQGEVFGVNFGKTPASRSMSLSCIDPTSYWDCVQAYYFNTQQTAGAGSLDMGPQVNSAIEAKLARVRIILQNLSSTSFFLQTIEKVMKDKTKDFLDGVIACYEDVGYVNDFFKSANYRMRISDQIAMHSSKKLLELLQGDEAYKWFVGLAGNHSGFTTLRLVLESLLRMIFHDSTTLLFPSPVKRTNAFSSEEGAPKRAYLKTSEQVSDATIGNFVFKPNLFMLPPPMCNVFFPDEYSSFQFSRNFFKEPTRLTYMPELPARFGRGQAAVYLPHVYEPPSYEGYMNSLEKMDKYVGKGSLEIPKNYGTWGDTDNDADRKNLNNGISRQWNFLTNEEHMKGIWGARENMMPATTSFREKLDITPGEKTKFTKRVAKYLFYKKRFQDRTLQITSHLKLSVVPGFPVLIADDSEADQNIIAYCNSVTHRIYATEGGYTNVQLTYARYVKEQDIASDKGAQCLIPPWMDATIFGEVKIPDLGTLDTPAKIEQANQGYQPVYPKKLSEFYAALLGPRGSKSLAALTSSGTALGGVRFLMSEYRTAKEKGTRDIQAFIRKYTARSYIRMEHFYEFLEAQTTTKDVDDSAEKWIQFNGKLFTRSGKPDAEPLAKRRAIIIKYRDELKSRRGFRG